MCDVIREGRAFWLIQSGHHPYVPPNTGGLLTVSRVSYHKVGTAAYSIKQPPSAYNRGKFPGQSKCDGLPRGERRDALCYLFDIFPSVCEIGNVSCPSSVEGKSLFPLIHNAELEGREALIFAYKDYQRGIRTRRWKLILTNVKGSKHSQLFDIKKDPFEKNNLADDPEHQTRVKELSEMLQSMMAAEGDSLRLDRPDWGRKP